MAGSCLSNSMCSFHHALLSVLWGYFENQRKLVGKVQLQIISMLVLIQAKNPPNKHPELSCRLPKAGWDWIQELNWHCVSSVYPHHCNSFGFSCQQPCSSRCHILTVERNQQPASSLQMWFLRAYPSGLGGRFGRSWFASCMSQKSLTKPKCPEIFLLK